MLSCMFCLIPCFLVFELLCPVFPVFSVCPVFHYFSFITLCFTKVFCFPCVFYFCPVPLTDNQRTELVRFAHNFCFHVKCVFRRFQYIIMHQSFFLIEDTLKCPLLPLFSRNESTVTVIVWKSHIR